jgi:hypothetical protein
MGRILAEPVTRGGIKSLAAVRPGSAWYLTQVFFILKRKSIKPDPGHQLLIEAKARANQVASGGDVRSKTVSPNSDEPIRTDETIADMAGESARRAGRRFASGEFSGSN